jgi:hypothetical protein
MGTVKGPTAGLPVAGQASPGAPDPGGPNVDKWPNKGGGAVGPGGGSSGSGLQSVIDAINDIKPVPIPEKVNAAPIKGTTVAPTTLEKVSMPAFLNLENIQQDRMTGLDLARQAEEAQTKDFLARTGFGNSTLSSSALGDIARKTEASRGDINAQIFGMALAEQGLYQRDNMTQAGLDQSRASQQASMDQQRRIQDVLNSIGAGQFNVQAALEATGMDIQRILGSAGLAADVILKDFYIMAQQDAAAQEAFASFLEMALG